MQNQPVSPNAPKTPVSNFRIPLDLKAAWQAKAEAQGETMTDVVIRAGWLYVSSDLLDKPSPSESSSS